MTLAMTPPKGWNSWDAYGASVNEEEVLRNARIMADKLQEYGWEYIVVDIQWYEPQANSSRYHDFYPLVMDQYSRLLPAENRFPSAQKNLGFKPLADEIHRLGLKFGIHIMRGIPREAVHKNMAIKGTKKTARDIALNNICPWNSDMYGVNVDLPEGQLYYDSLLELYASWGVDFIKVDDIADSKIYECSHRKEIQAIQKAIQKTNREIVLSLSPGPAHIEEGPFLQDQANMWRLTDDFWDQWPQLYQMFDKCREWSAFIQPGSWPDCDMLPLGHIGIRSVDGGASDRYTRFTKSEQRTMMTLWSIFQSPLMYGGELADLDPWTESLLTNPAVNQMHGTLTYQTEIFRDQKWIVWCGKSSDKIYYAIFNVSEEERNVPLQIIDKVLTKRRYLDLWENQFIEKEVILIESHDCILLEEVI